MAELNVLDAGVDGHQAVRRLDAEGSDCCSASAKETCCEPEAKSDCCGEGHDKGCGCSAGSISRPKAT